jgi:hypothetical protein
VPGGDPDPARGLIGGGDAPVRGASHLSREEVSVARTADELKPLIGLRRSVMLKVRMEPLRDWLNDQPGEWVRFRSVELGRPDEGLDRGAARRERQLEVRLRGAYRDRAAAQDPEEGLWSDAHSQAAADARWEKADATISATQGTLLSLRRRLDAWVIDRSVLAAAYADELAIRNEIAAAQEPPARSPRERGPGIDERAVEDRRGLRARGTVQAAPEGAGMET